MASEDFFYTCRLDSGIRALVMPSVSPITYVGFMINAGSRDERNNEKGLAHFIEHTIFKGTTNRNNRQIIDRIENVGGEINAYTTKEETALYCCVVNRYVERAVELMADMLLRSTFPEEQLEKEKQVIIEEIDSYKDNPAEQIYDDFEDYLFGNHELGHNILGSTNNVRRFGANDAKRFMERTYHSDSIVFFCYTSLPPKRVCDWAQKHFYRVPFCEPRSPRVKPQNYVPKQHPTKLKHHQVHCVIGGLSADMHSKDWYATNLLNNIIGGPGMNSRLNLLLREKHGLVYTVESSLVSFTDTGVWSVYFGCDRNDVDTCLKLINNNLNELCQQQITETLLRKYKTQIKGQLAIASQNAENVILSYAKNFLHRCELSTWTQVAEYYDAITAEQLLEIARRTVSPELLSTISM
ncbi:MAG: insulinase family protein [Paludibacteraceae bacterium]|nr:insulinase family protein [Paludibacteraceae bacterium]